MPGTAAKRVWQPPSALRSAYRSPTAATATERRAEQDRAAGGRAARAVQLGNGRSSIASVELKALPKSRRVYAYLRHTEQGRTVSRYLGEPAGETRAEALADAWRIARERGLLDDPRAGRRG